MITKIERGKVDISQKKIVAFANALGTTPRYLLDGDTEDVDRDRLEALHQNPRLCLLFDRTRKMSDADVETMLAVSASILKERDGE